MRGPPHLKGVDLSQEAHILGVKRVETRGKKLNAQHIFVWKIFIQKGVYELFAQKRDDIVITSQ